MAVTGNAGWPTKVSLYDSLTTLASHKRVTPYHGSQLAGIRTIS